MRTCGLMEDTANLGLQRTHTMIEKSSPCVQAPPYQSPIHAISIDFHDRDGRIYSSNDHWYLQTYAIRTCSGFESLTVIKQKEQYIVH